MKYKCISWISSSEIVQIVGISVGLIRKSTEN